jgi:hypothetical protein
MGTFGQRHSVDIQMAKRSAADRMLHSSEQRSGEDRLLDATRIELPNVGIEDWIGELAFWRAIFYLTAQASSWSAADHE